MTRPYPCRPLTPPSVLLSRSQVSVSRPVQRRRALSAPLPWAPHSDNLALRPSLSQLQQARHDARAKDPPLNSKLQRIRAFHTRPHQPHLHRHSHSYSTLPFHESTALSPWGQRNPLVNFGGCNRQILHLPLKSSPLTVARPISFQSDEEGGSVDENGEMVHHVPVPWDPMSPHAHDFDFGLRKRRHSGVQGGSEVVKQKDRGGAKLKKRRSSIVGVSGDGIRLVRDERGREEVANIPAHQTSSATLPLPRTFDIRGGSMVSLASLPEKGGRIELRGGDTKTHAKRKSVLRIIARYIREYFRPSPSTSRHHPNNSTDHGSFNDHELSDSFFSTPFIWSPEERENESGKARPNLIRQEYKLSFLDEVSYLPNPHRARFDI